VHFSRTFFFRKIYRKFSIFRKIYDKFDKFDFGIMALNFYIMNIHQMMLHTWIFTKWIKSKSVKMLKTKIFQSNMHTWGRFVTAHSFRTSITTCLTPILWEFEVITVFCPHFVYFSWVFCFVYNSVASFSTNLTAISRSAECWVLTHSEIL
jgi:hypothetical protein